MYAIEAKVRVFIVLTMIVTFISSFFFLNLITAFLLIYLYPTFLWSIARSMGESDSYTSVVVQIVLMTMFYVLIFALVYYDSGLISAGKLVEIPFITAIYFSITTLTTLGYGDFAPPPDIRLMTSLEAIIGYITLGVWVAVAMRYVSELSEKKKQIHEHNREISHQHLNEKKDTPEDANDNKN